MTTAARTGTTGAGTRLAARVTALIALVPALLVGGSATGASAQDVGIAGSGWGHGVGMPQYGAREQAVDGRTAAEILTYYYAGTSLGRQRDDMDVRVQVRASTGAVTARTAAVASGGGAFVVSNPLQQQLTGTVGDTLTFTRSSGTVVATVRRADGATATVSGAVLTVRWAGTRAMAGAATVAQVDLANGDRTTGSYRHGHLEVRDVGGRVNVVNVVRLRDEYLNGIGEMPSSWPRAALEAQAIASRTYALYHSRSGVRPACDCHLYDEVTHQKFIGWAKESEPTWGARWVDAVAGTTASPTEGRVVLHQGALIEALFFSSSGGRTQNSEDVYSTALPYARSVADPWSLRSSNANRLWRTTRSLSSVAAAFGLPGVARIDFSARTQGDAVRVATAWTSEGASASISGSQLRSRLGLNSAWIRRHVVRHAGPDRFTTAVEIGKAAAPSGTTVVLANGDDAHLVDGMVGAPLARALGAPLLLTKRAAVPAATDAELRRRGVTRAVVLGSEGAVGPEVVARLESLGIGVERLQGRDRYETAANVARRMGAPSRAALFANGRDASLVDVAAAGGPAAATRRPILLVQPDSVPESTRAASRDLGVTSGICVGSTAVLSESVRLSLPSCTRAGGVNRYETAAAVLERFRPLVDQSTVVVAPGRQANLVDTVTAGSLGRLTVLVEGPSAPAPTVIALQRTLGASTVVAPGGEAAVPQGVLEQLARS